MECGTTSWATNRITVDWLSPTSSEGRALPVMISAGRNGVTSNWSKVPSSFSRAIDIAVIRRISARVSVPTRLGRMLRRVSRFELYQARLVTFIGGPPPP